MPVRAALREWRRLLKPGGLVGFSTMKAGFPAAARLFREQATSYGLTLTDPVTSLRTPDGCRQELRDAGMVPTDVVEGAVRFSRTELEHAWQAHTLGPHHAAIATLTDDQTATFQAQ